ncbi:hypothetical protein DTO271D3_3235 [Paecilomyces variotii]|nr:hypothetical protein DTO271D3_3235 [Paecilomyces variotii]KAJ9389455.1 hypothetical protein DTO063F5_1948 [Paecilomyces variotii]
MPVCDACIVKESFAKKNNAYRTRTRYLCVQCWASGIPHRGRNFTSSPPKVTPYTFAPGEGDFCRCTAKDGWLCSACRAQQCTDVDLQRQCCIGEGCSNHPGTDGDRRRICLWCDLPLFGGQTMIERWQGYGERYMNSTINTPDEIRTALEETSKLSPVEEAA